MMIPYNVTANGNCNLMNVGTLIITGIMKFMGDYPMGSSQNEVDCALKLLRVSSKHQCQFN